MFRPAFNSVELATARGTVWVHHAGPGLLKTRVNGHVDKQIVQYLMDAFDRVAELHSPVDAFHDWEGVTSYDKDARALYVEWAKGHKESVHYVHILVKHPLIVFAISVANMALGGYLRSYADRDEFEMLYERTLQRVMADEPLRKLG